VNFIDAHVHVWTQDFAHYPLADGRAPDPVDPDFNAQKLLDLCRPVGVDRAVLIQPAEYGTDNRYMLDMIKLYRGTFSGVAVIDMSRPVTNTMLALNAQGVRGFRIIGHKTRADIANWLDGPSYHEMFDTCTKTGQSACCLIDPQALPALDRMCRKFPQTSVVIDHMARIGVDGTIRDADITALCEMARHNNVRVKISAFYALGKKRAPYTDLIPLIRPLYDAFGSSRLMWASDCPYQVQFGHTYRESVVLVRDRCVWLTAEEKDWLLRRTAEQVFFPAA
jgi:predicted TIM-barrel fold metal-dependent hydrolase